MATPDREAHAQQITDLFLDFTDHFLVGHIAVPEPLEQLLGDKKYLPDLQASTPFGTSGIRGLVDTSGRSIFSGHWPSTWT
jgi:hypothetical protein